MHDGAFELVTGAKITHNGIIVSRGSRRDDRFIGGTGRKLRAKRFVDLGTNTTGVFYRTNIALGTAISMLFFNWSTSFFRCLLAAGIIDNVDISVFYNRLSKIVVIIYG